MKFGKICKNAMWLMMAGAMAASAVACSPKVKKDPNAGKTKILVSLYAGGHGTAYFEKLVEDFMAKHPEYDEKYAIDYVPEKKHSALIEDECKAGIQKQMYIMAQNDVVSLAYQGFLEDVSDVTSSKVNGESVAIQDKMFRWNEWKNIYNVRGEGVYAMPYADSIGGWIYDHDMFLENNWYNFATAADKEALTAQGITYTEETGNLYFASSTGKTNYEEGDRILTAGKDGKYGTYDDGQPITEKEFDDMVKKIALTAKPFISSGKVGSYAQYIISSLVGQYGGVDLWETYFTYDSKGKEYELTDGTKTAITVKNGYQVASLKAIYQAYEWIAKYFNATNAEKYTHFATSSGTATHLDTQSYFLLGYKNAETNPMSAMLLEGAWWEYEARTVFEALGKIDKSRGYGKRDYRYMLLPNLDGQVNEKSVFTAAESGAMIVTKDSNKERLEVTKAFLGYMASDEAVKTFTTYTGCPMPYDVEFTAADEEKMTPFAKNMTELYYDSENIDVVRPNFATLWSPLAYTSDRGVYDYMLPIINSIEKTEPFKTVRENSLSAIKAGLASYYNKSDWDKWIEQAQKQGFYTDVE